MAEPLTDEEIAECRPGARGPMASHTFMDHCSTGEGVDRWLATVDARDAEIARLKAGARVATDNGEVIARLTERAEKAEADLMRVMAANERLGRMVDRHALPKSPGGEQVPAPTPAEGDAVGASGSGLGRGGGND